MSYTAAPRNFWTAADARDFINFAKTSPNDSGRKEPYMYKKMPKIVDFNAETINPKKKIISDALANVFYKDNSVYRIIPLFFYESLRTRLSTDRNTQDHYGKNIILLIKGNTAYNIMTEYKHTDVFKFSDLDIVVCVNPTLSDTDFNFINHSVHIITNQVISQFKRTFDHMFFGRTMEIDNSFINDEIKQGFISAYADMIQEVNDTSDLNGRFISPFDDAFEMRSLCSKNSFIIADTNDEEKVVMCEIPHFYQCDRIPLKKTPLYASYNDTISFNRAKEEGENIIGNFDLYKIKLNHAFIPFTKDKQTMEKISADFIDISIPKKNDAELINYWEKNRTVAIIEKIANVWVYIPDIMYSINELTRMLDMYNSQENKREKRVIKRKALSEFFQAMINDVVE